MTKTKKPIQKIFLIIERETLWVYLKDIKLKFDIHEEDIFQKLKKNNLLTEEKIVLYFYENIQILYCLFSKQFILGKIKKPTKNWLDYIHESKRIHGTFKYENHSIVLHDLRGWNEEGLETLLNMLNLKRDEIIKIPSSMLKHINSICEIYQFPNEWYFTEEQLDPNIFTIIENILRKFTYLYFSKDQNQKFSKQKFKE